MIKVSIIMPVYNSEKYLESAINSIMNQSFNNFELILVNDGSSDTSLEICESYKHTDDRIIIVNKQNGGICSARNAGLKVSRGQYIMFFDHDDICNNKFIEDNLNIIENSSYELVKFSVNYIVINQNGSSKIKKLHKVKQGEYFKKEINKNYKSLRRQGIFTFVWNSIYKASIIKKNAIKFDESMKYGGEDFKFNLDYFKHVNTFYFNNEKYYTHYRRFNISQSTIVNINKSYTNQKLAICEHDFMLNYLSTKKFLWHIYSIEYIIGSIFPIINEYWYKSDTKSIKDFINNNIDMNMFNFHPNIIDEFRLFILMPYKYIFVKLFINRKYVFLLNLYKIYRKARRR